MSTVLVKYRGHLAALTGIAEENIDAEDVNGLLKSIRRQYSREAEKAARTMLITLNGKSILLLKQYKTILKSGDKVSFFPLCAGG